MHFTGLAGEPRHYAQLTGIPNAAGRTCSPATLPLNLHITYAAIFLAAAQLLFLFNLVRSLRRGAASSLNPWQATTLEWHPALHPSAAGFRIRYEKITVYRSPCEYRTSPAGDVSFLPQWSEDAVTDVKPE